MEPMSFQRRAGIVSLIFIAALTVYGLARLYSHPLIIYVVEQSLIQKAPAGSDPGLLRARFHAMLAAMPDRNVRLPNT